jgi:hypothetical protein
MNLGKLLGAGKTFFGGKDMARYRGTSSFICRNSMRTNMRSRRSRRNPHRRRAKMKRWPRRLPPRRRKSPRPPPSARPAHVTSWKTRLNPFRAPAPVAPPHLTRCSRNFRWRPSSRWHNDLSDADIEIVPVKSHTVTAVTVAARSAHAAAGARGVGIFGRAAGETRLRCTVPEFIHQPVLAAEVLAALKPSPGRPLRRRDARWSWSRRGHTGREFADGMAVWVRSRWGRG